MTKRNFFCFFQDWATPHWRRSPILTLQVYAAALITVTLLSCLGHLFFSSLLVPSLQAEAPTKVWSCQTCSWHPAFSLASLCHRPQWSAAESKHLHAKSIGWEEWYAAECSCNLYIIVIWCGCHCTAGCKWFYFTVHMRAHLGFLGEYSQVIRVGWETMTYFCPALPLTNCDRQSC